MMYRLYVAVNECLIMEIRKTSSGEALLSMTNEESLGECGHGFGFVVIDVEQRQKAYHLEGL
jgi:hypothetical protein